MDNTTCGKVYVETNLIPTSAILVRISMFYLSWIRFNVPASFVRASIEVHACLDETPQPYRVSTTRISRQNHRMPYPFIFINPQNTFCAPKRDSLSHPSCKGMMLFVNKPGITAGWRLCLPMATGNTLSVSCHQRQVDSRSSDKPPARIAF